MSMNPDLRIVVGHDPSNLLVAIRGEPQAGYIVSVDGSSFSRLGREAYAQRRTSCCGSLPYCSGAEQKKTCWGCNRLLPDFTCSLDHGSHNHVVRWYESSKTLIEQLFNERLPGVDPLSRIVLVEHVLDQLDNAYWLNETASIPLAPFLSESAP